MTHSERRSHTISRFFLFMSDSFRKKISHHLTILFIHESLPQKEDLTPSHDSFWECREWLTQKEDLTPSHDSFYSWVTPSERRSYTISRFFLYMSLSPKKKILHHLTILRIHEWLPQIEDFTLSHNSDYKWDAPKNKISHSSKTVVEPWSIVVPWWLQLAIPQVDYTVEYL